MRCFVVMGFGTKTDLATGRKLNLDKSYQALIKPVIEAKGMECVRADEIPDSGNIDVPMYKELLKADIVIADLSTANANAFYELGVRYALRPRATIVMSEDQLCFPFDVNHMRIKKYTHLGESIDYFEVLRFQKLLGETLDYVLKNTEEPDSPVYTFLNGLIPPALKDKAEAVATEVKEAIANSPTEKDNNKQDPTLATIVQRGEQAIKHKQYSLAKIFFNSAIELSKCDNQTNISSNNAYLYQRLALATYKALEPNQLEALKEAMALLQKLDLARTNDSETVVLAGDIEKKLYEFAKEDKHLNENEHLANAILLFQRAYYLLNNRYNGIHLAYLLNCKADSSMDKTDEEKIADMIWANRVRQDVLRMCEKDWTSIIKRHDRNQLQNEKIDEDLLKVQEATENEQKFWILVNKAEANHGLGNMEEYKEAVAQAKVMEHEDWMMEAFKKQVKSLGDLMKKHAHLIKLNWKEL
jgi:hypothetical protein